MKDNKNKKEYSSQSDTTYVLLTIASLVIALFFMASLLNSVNNNEDQWPLGVNGFTEYLFGKSSSDNKKMDKKQKNLFQKIKTVSHLYFLNLHYNKKRNFLNL